MSLYPILWAVDHAPVRDAEERAVLVALVIKGDFDGLNCFRSYRSLADKARVDPKTAGRRCREMEARGILRRQEEHLSPAWRKIPEEQRPVPWEVMIPAEWWGPAQLEDVNEQRAALGRPPLTAENRPPLAEAPPKKARADRGVKRPKKAVEPKQPTGLVDPAPGTDSPPPQGLVVPAPGDYQSPPPGLVVPTPGTSSPYPGDCQSPPPGLVVPQPSETPSEAPSESPSEGPSEGADGVEVGGDGAGSGARAASQPDGRALPAAPIDLDGFVLTDSMRRWAAATVPGLDADYETAQFVDHHRAEGRRRSNWPAEWQKWLRRSAKYASERQTRQAPGRPGPTAAARPSTTDQRVLAAREAGRRVQAKLDALKQEQHA